VLKKRLIIIASIIAFFVVFHFATGSKFLTLVNIRTILSHAVVPTIITLGMCFLFSSGVIDLSIGSIVILAANAGGLASTILGYPGLIIGSILGATLLVLFNLKIYMTLKIPSWLLGLGMAMIYETIAMLYSSSQVAKGKQVIDLGNVCRDLGTFPINVIVMAVAIAVAYFIFYRTTAGLNIRAVGSSEPISKIMGIDVNKALIIGGIIGGIFIGLGAAVKESYIGRVMPTSGLTSIGEIYMPLAALLLAQSLDKIFPRIIGIFISSLFVSSLSNILTISGVPSGTWQEVMLAVCIISFGVLSQRKNMGVVK
jgi:ribose transport system permease protein